MKRERENEEEREKATDTINNGKLGRQTTHCDSLGDVLTKDKA